MPQFLALKVPLSQNQVQAANRLYQRLDQWRLSDTTLYRLREILPSFDAESCLLKSLAINQLYGTQVRAIIPLAQHVKSKLCGLDIVAQGVELVDEIAAFLHKGKLSRRVSFAAKFCHFFVNEERFPIYDQGAQRALKLHLGRSYLNDADRPYGAFCENLRRLCTAAGIQGSTSDIDRYLWIVGMYMRWERDPRINAELRKVFEKPSTDEAADLADILPPSLQT